MKTIYCADLFCGAGGFTAGLLDAADDLGLDIDLTAVNHWDIAISTHSRNHPRVKHLCETLEGVDPRAIVPGGMLDLLVASPECIHHSRARGGKPMSPQSRASIYHVLRWCDSLHVKNVLIENVKEFQEWGPLYPPDYEDEKLRNRPIASKKGLLFRRFLGDLRARGYKVDFRVLNAAHYGDATTRHRFFLQATLEDRDVVWPTLSHVGPNELSLFEGALPWRTAREIIDWSLPGKSIYGRKKPLAQNTHKRIFAGLHKFSNLPAVEIGEDGRIPLFLIRPEDVVHLTGFVMGAGGTTGQQKPQSADGPLGTVMTQDRRALINPCLTEYHGSKGDQERIREVDTPLATVDTSNRFGLMQPVVLPVTHSGDPSRCGSVESPLQTITTARRGEFAVAQPFLVPQFGERDGQAPRTHDVTVPLPAVTGHGAGAVCQSFLATLEHSTEASGHKRRVKSIDAPIPTLTARQGWAACFPYLVKFYGDHNAACVDEPINTITANYEHYGLVDPYLVVFRNHMDGASPDKPLGTICTSAAHFGLAQPCLVNYNGTGIPHSCENPLDTVTTKDRFGLIEPLLVEQEIDASNLLMIDIRFRMLQPHELAAAHSFQKSYLFAGTRDDQVRQIGNSVPVRLSKALCKAALIGCAEPVLVLAADAVA